MRYCMDSQIIENNGSSSNLKLVVYWIDLITLNFSESFNSSSPPPLLSSRDVQDIYRNDRQLEIVDRWIFA